MNRVARPHAPMPTMPLLAPRPMQGGDSAPSAAPHATKSAAAAAAAPKSAAMRTFHVILPILILIIALALNFFYASTKK